MPERDFLMPDVGEGIAEAEVVAWLVEVGAVVEVDQPLVEVLTDKASVEISSPLAGTVRALGAAVGSPVAVGAPLVTFADDGAALVASPAPSSLPDERTTDPTPDPGPEPMAETVDAASAATAPTAPPLPVGAPPAPSAAPPTRPLASPSVRQRARQAGVDLAAVAGRGPGGRIEHEDLDRHLAGPSVPTGRARAADTGITEVPVVGLRRRIGERMSLSASRIPHFTYVEEVDLTAVEELRATLNGGDGPRLTLLPFVVLALVEALGEHPAFNARYDDDAGVVHRHGGVHVGIATQTDRGLLVPVLRHAEARDLWDVATEVRRLADAARAGTAGPDELSGSTITITSLGALGGVATTPVINHPEVAIVGINKVRVQPVWDGTAFVPRRVANLSSSFDHRVVDGWDAATFIQRIRGLLEQPAALFVGRPPVCGEDR